MLMHCYCGNRIGAVNPAANVIPEMTQSAPQKRQKYVSTRMALSDPKNPGVRRSRNQRHSRGEQAIRRAK